MVVREDGFIEAHFMGFNDGEVGDRVIGDDLSLRVFLDKILEDLLCRRAGDGCGEDNDIIIFFECNLFKFRFNLSIDIFPGYFFLGCHRGFEAMLVIEVE